MNINDGTMKAMDKNVGLKIRHRRVEKGITQMKLANALGLSYQQIQKYETGSNRVSSGRLFYIALFLDKPLGYFYSIVPEEFQSQIAERAKRRDAMHDLTGMDDHLKKAVSNLIRALKS